MKFLKSNISSQEVLEISNENQFTYTFKHLAYNIKEGYVKGGLKEAFSEALYGILLFPIAYILDWCFYEEQWEDDLVGKWKSLPTREKYKKMQEENKRTTEMVKNYDKVLDYISANMKNDAFFTKGKHSIYSAHDYLNFCKICVQRYTLAKKIEGPYPDETAKDWLARMRKLIGMNKLPDLPKIKQKSLTYAESGFLDKALLHEIFDLESQAMDLCNYVNQENVFYVSINGSETISKYDGSNGFEEAANKIGFFDACNSYWDNPGIDHFENGKIDVIKAISMYVGEKTLKPKNESSKEGFFDIFKSKKKEEIESGSSDPLEKFCLAVDDYDGQTKLNLPESGQYMTYGNFMKYVTLLREVDNAAQSWYMDNAWNFIEDLYDALDDQTDMNSDGSSQLSALIRIYQKLVPFIKTSSGKVCPIPESLELKEDERSFENGVGPSSRFRKPAEVKKFKGMLNSTCFLLIDEDFDKRQWSRFNWAYYMTQITHESNLLPAERKAFNDETMGGWNYSTCLSNLKDLDSVVETDVKKKAILNYARMYYLVGIMTGICKKIYGKMKPTMSMLANAMKSVNHSEEKLQDSEFWW